MERWGSRSEAMVVFLLACVLALSQLELSKADLTNTSREAKLEAWR